MVTGLAMRATQRHVVMASSKALRLVILQTLAVKHASLVGSWMADFSSALRTASLIQAVVQTAEMALWKSAKNATMAMQSMMMAALLPVPYQFAAMML